MFIILKKFCFAVKLSRSSRLDSKVSLIPRLFFLRSFLCVCVCVCVRVITNQFPRVLSAVSSVCVWSVGGRESSWNSGWNPRSLLVSSLSANQIKQKRVSKNKLSRTRTCLRPHPAALLYIYVCVCLFLSRSVIFTFLFLRKIENESPSAVVSKTMLCFII